METPLNQNKWQIPLGYKVEGKGIYMGEWAPVDERERSLRAVFDIYAAPHDLCDQAGKPLVVNYKDAMKAVSDLKNWNGYSGAKVTSDSDIFYAIRYEGYEHLKNWFIPTSDLLSGVHAHLGRTINMNSLYMNKGKGDLFYTFNSASGKYWSSSVNPSNRTEAMMCDFNAGYASSLDRETTKLAIRPVRAEFKYKR